MPLYTKDIVDSFATIIGIGWLIFWVGYCLDYWHNWMYALDILFVKNHWAQINNWETYNGLHEITIEGTAFAGSLALKFLIFAFVAVLVLLVIRKIDEAIKDKYQLYDPL